MMVSARHGLALLMLLSACASDQDPVLKQLPSALKEVVAKTRAERAAELEARTAELLATADSLRNFEAPILLVTMVDAGVVGVIGPSVTNGTDTTWFSGDGVSLTFRHDGMVAATRGMQQDLESALVPDARSVRGSFTRTHFYRLGDESMVREDYDCAMVDSGPETIEILGMSYGVRAVTESCQGAGRSFTNTYWLGPDDTFRQSRQWMGPIVGAIVVQKVQQ